jgi:AsmA protein
VSAVTGIKRVGIAIGVLVAAGFGGLLLLSLLIPADTVRDGVKAQILEVTGLDPVLTGDVAVSLFPSGSVRFSDVSLGDKRVGTAALTAEQLVVRLRFFPLLIGRVQIADVTLVRPTVTIAFLPDGRSNWSNHVETLARALRPASGPMPSFSEIRIADGTILLYDQEFKTVETLTNVDFALAWPSISKTFAATGHFSWHDQLLDATLSLTDFVAALTGERSGLKLRLAGAPLRFAFDGYISHRPTLRMEGTLAADGMSLREALRWATRWAPPDGGFGRFALKAQTSVAGANVSLSGVNVELDGNAGEGVLTFVNDGRQTVQGTLAAEGVDLTPYVSTVRLLTGTDRSWNRAPINLDNLNSIDADLRLSAARVTVGGAKFGRTAAAANLRAGNLTLAIGESQAFGGIVKGSFGLAKSSAGAELKAQLQFTDVDLDQSLGELIGVRRIEGKGDVSLAVDGAGASVYDLAKGLNGTVTLASRKGAIAGINLEQLLRRLERNPLAARGDPRGGKTPYDTLAVSLKVTKGTANVEDMRVESSPARLAFAGSASIPARDLDLKGVASLISGTARDAVFFELPFVVQGPWDDPIIWPDAQALINRSGAAAPLLDAVRNRLKRDAARPSPEPAAGAPPPAAAAPPSQPASTVEDPPLTAR